MPKNTCDIVGVTLHQVSLPKDKHKQRIIRILNHGCHPLHFAGMICVACRNLLLGPG
jgi:hypothetical protein